MKNFYAALTAILMIWLCADDAVGQVVTTSPAVLTPDSKNVVITFHADWGSQGLMNLPASDEVYAHTGVITNLSTSASDWKHAPAWGTNTEKYRLKREGDNLYTLTIGDMREFYGITSPDEKIERLAFVFRNAKSTREGKTVAWGDVFVTLLPSVFPECREAGFPGGTPRQGVTANAEGSATICLCATGKDNVLLIGSWNDYALVPEQMMNYQNYYGQRYYWLTVPGIADGEDYIYYFMMDQQTSVGDPYARLVVTPDDKTIPSWVFPDRPEYPAAKLPGVHAAVYNSNADEYDWKVTDFKGVPQSELIVYEMLLRDFTGDEGASKGNGNIYGAIAKLGYLKELGVNAIELMPIMEFNGNQSWGYNTNFYFAPDKAYGSPDDYRMLIDRAHEMGMAVILDIVFNQADGQHPWWGMYNIPDNPRFNGSAPHAYSVLNDWHQGDAMVQQQFEDCLRYWLTAYKVDGFRFDLVKGLGDNDSYNNTYNPATNTFGTPNDGNTNAYNATRVARMKALHAAMKEVNPDAYFINENLATAKEENEMAADGEINWANINNSACQFAMGYPTDASLNRFYAPSDSRTWGSTVSYVVSHDEERPAYKQSKWGVDGVKGNAAMSCRRLGSLAAQMLLTPGAHMIWQFEEFGADQTTKNSSGNDTGNKRVVWSYLDREPNRALFESYKQLLAIRNSAPELFREGVQTSVNLSATTSARSLSLVSGNKAIYLFVNPTVDTDLACATGIDLTAAGYHLLSASEGMTPALTSSTVTLPGGAYAVYGTTNVTGINETAADAGAAYSVTAVGGDIVVLGSYTTAEAYTPAGVRVPMQGVAPGLYIVVVDGRASKIVVR